MPCKRGAREGAARLWRGNLCHATYAAAHAPSPAWSLLARRVSRSAWILEESTKSRCFWGRFGFVGSGGSWAFIGKSEKERECGAVEDGGPDIWCHAGTDDDNAQEEAREGGGRGGSWRTPLSAGSRIIVPWCATTHLRNIIKIAAHILSLFRYCSCVLNLPDCCRVRREHIWRTCMLKTRVDLRVRRPRTLEPPLLGRHTPLLPPLPPICLETQHHTKK